MSQKRKMNRQLSKILILRELEAVVELFGMFPDVLFVWVSIDFKNTVIRNFNVSSALKHILNEKQAQK